MTAQMGILSLVRLVCEYSLSCTLFSKWRLWNTCMLHVSLNVKLILNQPSVKRHFRICISQRSHVPGHPPYTITISSFFPENFKPSIIILGTCNTMSVYLITAVTVFLILVTWRLQNRVLCAAGLAEPSLGEYKNRCNSKNTFRVMAKSWKELKELSNIKLCITKFWTWPLCVM